MSAEQIIVVVGATGNQGSSVANTFLSLPYWHVRCITRNPASATAQDLSTRGAEVVQGDLEDPASLAESFKGAHAIFVNTDFWATWKPAVASGSSPEEATKGATRVETTHGKNAVDEAAKIPSLKILVYSTLPPMSKVSHGKYHRSGHWEAKAWVVDYTERDHPALHQKTSLIMLGAYRDTNTNLKPKVNAELGKYVLALPLKESTRMPLIDVNNSTGLFVRCLVEDEEPQTMLMAYDSNSRPTLREFVAAWSKASGQEAVYRRLSLQDLVKGGVSYEHADAVAFVDEFGYSDWSDRYIHPHQLKNPPKTKSYVEWLEGRDWKSVLESL